MSLRLYLIERQQEGGIHSRFAGVKVQLFDRCGRARAIDLIGRAAHAVLLRD
jgi:hypothetical protein